MKRLRAVTKLTLAVLNSLFFAGVLLVGKLFLFPFARLDARWRMFVFRLWSRGMLWALGVRVESVGEPPEPPFFLVSNHLSYLDIPVIGRYAGAIFIAKSEISSWPLVGFLCRIVNTIFIDRSIRRDLPRVMREIHSELHNGMGVVLFAEGTSSRGAGVSYHTGDDDPPAHDAVCWWGGAPFSPHAFACAALRRIDARVVFGCKRIHHADRKQLATQLRDEIQKIFEPVVGEDDTAA
jgi:1-acyl-sn-glycerol-3-phosphate acyltransferase